MTYTDLQAQIALWQHRSDLTSVIPSFIALCETRLNRNLRVRQMETSLSQQVSSKTVPTPPDWLEFIGQPRLDGIPLDFVTRDEYRRLQERSQSTTYYTISGANLLLAPTIADPITLDFDYYAKIPALSDAATSNWLLTDGFDLYLYGSLVESEPYLKNDARVETWRGFLQVALTDIQAASDKAKFSAPLTIRTSP